MNRTRLIASLILVFGLLIGCAHVVPPESRRTVEPGLTPEMLFENPDLYRGKTVMLGGVVISSKNTSEGSYLEILERPLDSLERPRDVDVSRGRFLILSEKYLETAIFTQGREVTVVGEMMGSERRPLGESEYTYPLIKSREIYLLSPRRTMPIRFGIGIWTAF